MNHLTKMQPEVIGLGVSAVDYLALFPHFPEQDEKTRIPKFSKQGGGPAATALVTLARFGITTGYVGKVGGDDFGEFILQGLKEERVDTSRVIIDKKAPSLFAFVIVEKERGTRTILWREGNRSPLKISELDQDYILGGKILHLDGNEAEAAIWTAKKARGKGITVVLDADIILPGIEELIKLADVVIPSRSVATKVTHKNDPEEAAKEIFSWGPKIVAITLGGKGCFCKSKDEAFFQPSLKIEVVDTTGAGDVFHGAFIYGLLQGWDIRKIARFSNGVAALNCTKLGGRAGIPTLSQALNLLRKL